ncbi:MAG: hypothetical protein QXT73_00580 [Candidatus Methanomethylicaceae archaeon]
MFDLSIQNERVVITDVQGGQEFELIHYIRRPTTAEFIQYNRRLTETKATGKRLSFEFRRVEAGQWLYDQLISNVENYSWKGKDITKLTDSELKSLGVRSWKDLVPLPHKLEVVEFILRPSILSAEAVEELGESSEES